MKSTAGLRRTMKSMPVVPNEENHGTVHLEETSEESRIPTKYHIIQEFPIMPQNLTKKGYKCTFENGVWRVTLWPSNTSNYKDEVRYLRSAVDLMMEDIDVSVDEQDENTAHLQIVKKKAELLEVALNELNRQVTRENSERGKLMTHLLDMYSNLFAELPALYNNLFTDMKKENQKIKNEMEEAQMNVAERESAAQEEVRSLRILLDMQQQWHNDVEEQIDEWQESVKNFNQKLKAELKTQKDSYEEKLQELQTQLDAAIAERDAYKSQIDWEQKSISDREVETIEIRKQLDQTKALLDEREQTLYTTRTHFERQFTFMREQMGQMLAKNGVGGDIDQLHSMTQYLPPRQGEQLPFLPIPEVNKRILDIYVSRTRHDAAYSPGNEPPLYKYVIKYHINLMFGYNSAIQALWQFLSSCGRYRHESLNVGTFMSQLEDQTNSLQVIEYMCLLVKKESLGENGLPRLSINRCAELAARLLPEDEIEKLKRLLERKILNPKRGLYVDFDTFVSVLIDLHIDTNHAIRQRIMYQFNELTSQGDPIDWTAFHDFVVRFAPYFSTQEIGDLFLEAIQSSLPSTSITSSAFQLLVDNGTFEKLQSTLNDDLEVANPEEIAQFVNMRWISDVVSPVQKALIELKTEKMAECHTFFTKLSRIFEHMKTPCTMEDSGTGLSLLHLAAILLVRYKFIKVARKDSTAAQKEVRKIVDLIWT